MLYHPTELVKSQDVIVRVGSIGGTSRPIITQSGATFTVSGAPTLYTLQAATTASVAFNDGNQEFYLLGGGGFADSVITTSQATASITSYFQTVLTRLSKWLALAAPTRTTKCTWKSISNWALQATLTTMTGWHLLLA